MKVDTGRKSLYKEYDSLAAYYQRWSAADPAAVPSLTFYRNLCRDVEEMVELGVGDGRIAIEVAKEGTLVFGVDSSTLMLEQCKERARRAGVADRIKLIHADIRDFKTSPMPLITCPFRSIGHLLTSVDRLELMKNVRRNLAVGGRFVFDHYVFDPVWAAKHDGIPREMVCWQTDDGGNCRIFDTYDYDFKQQRMGCSITAESLDCCGRVMQSATHPLSFSWIEPQEIRILAQEAELIVEALYGDFERGSFHNGSGEQIWVLRV